VELALRDKRRLSNLLPGDNLEVAEWLIIRCVERDKRQLIYCGDCSDLAVSKWRRFPNGSQAGTFDCMPLCRVRVIRQDWDGGLNYFD
jgi:hypothetical protein